MATRVHLPKRNIAMNKAILGDQCAPELTNYLVAECERRRRGEWEKESRGAVKQMGRGVM